MRRASGTHPLMAPGVEIAGSGAFVWTGRLSALMQPWLADHTIQTDIVVPGTAFLEMALKAAQDTGCGHVAELNLRAPLVLPEHGEARIQVWAGAPDESGDRDLTIHSQSSEDPHAPWTEHASGRLTTEARRSSRSTRCPGRRSMRSRSTPPGSTRGSPRPDSATGRLFQGLRAAWQRGDELFAEVALPEEVDGTGYGLHPALLDACLHTGALAVREADGWNGLPFSWTGVSLHAQSASLQCGSGSPRREKAPFR